ncbi:MAG: pyridoxamine 5'-phosphate oxidase [Proteobacteria bacterium]|nr:pyridoxamine 5'-phosphate oxidase [Burkholderiales bacterium]
MNALDLAHLRKDYLHARLDVDDVDRDPVAQFGRWMKEALDAALPEPTAMTLATVDASGQPSARIVLLKQFDARGFAFFTNYSSRKGRDLAANPRAALLFHWTELERQVRIEGRVEMLPDAESDAYYAVRPFGSRIGAWASPQSEVLPDRALLELRLSEAQRTLGDDPPRPPFWGGYRLSAHGFEFWQGRSSRLHDRVRYRRADHDTADAGANWTIDRLAP